MFLVIIDKENKMYTKVFVVSLKATHGNQVHALNSALDQVVISVTRVTPCKG